MKKRIARDTEKVAKLQERIRMDNCRLSAVSQELARNPLLKCRCIKDDLEIYMRARNEKVHYEDAHEALLAAGWWRKGCKLKTVQDYFAKGGACGCFNTFFSCGDGYYRINPDRITPLRELRRLLR